MKAIIAQTTSDLPKIKVTQYGAEVTFEVYNVSIDKLREYCGKELELEIKSEC